MAMSRSIEQEGREEGRLNTGTLKKKREERERAMELPESFLDLKRERKRRGKGEERTEGEEGRHSGFSVKA